MVWRALRTVFGRARRDEAMSIGWVRGQRDRDMRAGAPWEGVSWKRPRCPIRDENGFWNRHVERRRREA